MTEHLLDSENWKLEAEAVINDIKDHVKSIEVSQINQNCDTSVYLNLKTLEDQSFCIQLSAQGFKIVGNSADETNIDTDKYYETPYALLNEVSPKFQESFRNALLNKLTAL